MTTGALDRRRLLAWTGAAAGAAALGPALPGRRARAVAVDAEPTADPVKVVLLVVDGLNPDELPRMTFLQSLADQGTRWTGGRAQMVAETTTNHVSMMCGMRADRTGLPGNGVPYLAENIGFEPRYLQADSVFTLAAVQAPELVTATPQSKDYIVGVVEHDRTGDGEQDADSTPDPPFFVPGSGHAPDTEVMPLAIQASRDLDPDFLFVSLGDVDRVGHTDVTGGGTTALPTGSAPLGREVTLQQTDGLIRAFVTDLQQRGVWERTVLLVTADHGMDWSTPDSFVSVITGSPLEPFFTFADNGGAGLYALLQPAHPEAGDLLRRLRERALATEGVREALYTQPNPDDGGEQHWVGRVHPDWALTGDHTGDLVLVLEDGFRLSESPTDNPIPGNHGHSVTLPIPVFVAGGAPVVARGQVVEAPQGLADDERDPAQPENVDMGPTAAWLLGLEPPAGGFDGRVLAEAFTARPRPRVPSNGARTVPVTERVAGSTRYGTAAELSRRAFGDPEAVDAVVLASGADFPDALAGVPLAAVLGGPLLLTQRDVLPTETAAEIRRLGPSQVVVLGGPSAVEDQVLAQVAAAGPGTEGVRRIGGEDRFETAALVADEVAAADSFVGDVVVAVGRHPDFEAFPDALAAGPAAVRRGRPVLLVRPDGLPDATRRALVRIGARRALVVGGTAAVSQAVADAVESTGARVERLGGTDRYATAALLLERAVREGALTDALLLATGEEFPDALAAGAALAAAGGLLLLLDGVGTNPAVTDVLTRRADQLVELVTVGGSRAISPAVEQRVRDLVEARRRR